MDINADHLGNTNNPSTKKPSATSQNPYNEDTTPAITVSSLNNAVTLTHDQIEAVCNDILSSITPLKSLCHKHGISIQAFYKTIQENQDDMQTYINATNTRQLRAYETLFEKIDELDQIQKNQTMGAAQRKQNTKRDPQMIFARVSTLKTMIAELRWIASRNPAFSDKQTIGLADLSKNANSKQLNANTDALKLIPQIDQALQK